jgi:hypothetical protein
MGEGPIATYYSDSKRYWMRNRWGFLFVLFKTVIDVLDFLLPS